MNELEKFCRAFVAHKYHLDDEGEAKAKKNSENLYSAKAYTINPIHFIYNTILFWNSEPIGEEVLMKVNPGLVIGGTYDSYTDDSAAQCYRINADKSKVAEYWQIGNLPLFVASEGKNRVRLFQRHNLMIKAKVQKMSFPPPDSLQLHQSLFKDEYLFSCSDDKFTDRKAEMVRSLYPEIMLPLFGAYGVRIGSRRFALSPLFRKRSTIEQAIESGFTKGR